MHILEGKELVTSQEEIIANLEIKKNLKLIRRDLQNHPLILNMAFFDLLWKCKSVQLHLNKCRKR